MSKRLYFGNIKEVIEPPNLIEIQLQSYFDFLQQDTPAAARKNIGLQGVLKEIFPIKSYDENIELDFVSYDIEQPKMSDYEAIRAGETYSAALQVTFKLKSDNESKEETVYMGELPMMTNRGTFVINGAERVIVSQLHRSPGICFESAQHLNGKLLHSFRIIPDRGSWLEVQFDTNDLLYVYLDRRRRRRKFLATTFMRYLGFKTDRDIVSQFYNIRTLPLSEDMTEEDLHNLVAVDTIKDKDLVLAKAFEQLNMGVVRQLLQFGIKKIDVIDQSEDQASPGRRRDGSRIAPGRMAESCGAIPRPAIQPSFHCQGSGHHSGASTGHALPSPAVAGSPAGKTEGPVRQRRRSFHPHTDRIILYCVKCFLLQFLCFLEKSFIIHV